MVDFTVLDLLDLDLKEHNYLYLKCVAGRSGLSRKITIAKISRPGLALSGYFEDFDFTSIQLFGLSEQSYIDRLEEKNDYSTIEKFFQYEIPCAIFTCNYTPSEHIKELAEKNAITLLTTPLDTSDLSRRAYSILDEVFASTATIHGVLVEVFGIGVLITGSSGVGKSETALELIERGHRLISDDTVKLKAIADSYLVGAGENPLIAHHMELRGLGIIDITNLFGVGAIREKKHVQLAVELEEWKDDKVYDRIGDSVTATYLGITIPKVIIPVRPGRNVPILIETAARNERLKKLGYHSSQDFNKSVMKWLECEEAKELYKNEFEENE